MGRCVTGVVVSLDQHDTAGWRQITSEARLVTRQVTHRDLGNCEGGSRVTPSFKHGKAIAH